MLVVGGRVLMTFLTISSTIIASASVHEILQRLTPMVDTGVGGHTAGVGGVWVHPQICFGKDKVQ